MKRTIWIVLLTCLFTAGAHAQTTGTLIGNVTTDGVPLPGVTVTASSPQLQGTRVAVSDINGNYKIGALPPGSYTVVFELEGMRAVTRKVNVNVSGTSRADAAMVLSAVAEAITVTASAPAVLETTEVQTNLGGDFVESLPLGRNILDTVALAPGVNDIGSVGGDGAPVISGAPSYDSVYFVDGAVVNENLRGAPQSVFIEDAIQETTVMTGGISAEFGRFTGGVVNTITKSGGNQFEGSLRSNFDSDDWREERPTEDAVPDTDVTEVYEGTLGGFIMRDRLWFFTSGRYFEEDSVEFLARSSEFFVPNSQEETRLQGKLTGQITPNHSLVGTLLDVDNPQLSTFGTPAEASVLDDREVPESFWSLNYSGILTSNLLVEGLYAEKELTFKDQGGEAIGPPLSRERFVTGTAVRLRRFSDARAGAPTFGNPLGDIERDSENLTLKGTYYLSTANLGTHNIVAGYDDFTQMTTENNNQSASDFSFWTYDRNIHYTDDGQLRVGVPSTGLSAFIIYWPVLEASQGSNFNTQSFFLNDKWDLNSKLSFNLGVRYDENDAQDQFGQTVADDSKISPRLSATYDLFGDGRVRVSGTYAEYVSAIAGGNVGDGASPAGSPSLLYWIYRGPEIAPTDTREMLGEVWDWFQSVGGIENRSLLLGGGASGFSTQIEGTLDSPGVEEFTLGIGSQVGTNGFVRLDYQHREWDDFYISEQTLDSPIIQDPLLGGPIQVTFLTNASSGTVREYDAAIFQGGYRLTDRLNLGAFYTWSELTGNYGGETATAGPVSEAGVNFQPELIGFAQQNPVGILNEDRTHKLNAWISYDLPTPVGNFNFSLLQNYNSGEPYEMAGTITIERGPAEDDMCPVCRENPGYIQPSTTATYFFEDRGANRLDDWTRTDFALNYALPLGPVDLFFQGEVFNIFNEDEVVDIDETVLTAADDASLEYFDPFTDTPVEGVHFKKGANFGQPVSPLDYQAPRSWRFSAGLRF